MSRITIILGAGASVEAGGPLMDNFLEIADGLRRSGAVGEDAENFDLVFKGISALQAVHSKAAFDIYNIESVFAGFEMAGLFSRLGSLKPTEIRKLGPAMRRLIVKTLEERINYPIDRMQVRPPIPYGDFVDLVTMVSPEDISVITFNYDLALDYAFFWKKAPIDYCLGSTKDPTRIDVMKLHGSLNWVRCGKCRNTIPWELPQYFSRYHWNLYGEEKAPAQLKLPSYLMEYSHCETKVIPDPVIVPPTWNKTLYHQQIGAVWRRAAQHLSQAENIIVFGYSLPETDQFFHYLYALGTVSDVLLKHFLVFDPDETGKVRSRYEVLIGQAAKDRFEIHQETFLSSLRKGWLKDLIREGKARGELIAW